ncbi:MAG: hypothetical protein EBU90_21110 [Proteobacteria bacterium]|nr:hypothetical protein [Pseudomonadota bacterium]
MSLKYKVNQIFHTSHCGSTLMASLLKSSAKVYTEPSWTHSFWDSKNNIIFNRMMKNYDYGSVIKFPSPLCNYSDNFPGKKVFLYRNLRRHLFKIKHIKFINHFNGMKCILDSYYDYNLKTCHPSLSEIFFDTDLKKTIFMWANKIQWISESKDILWIESNNFFKNKKDTMDLVCKHFEMPLINDYSLANVYVKGIGMNHSDIQLDKVVPDMTKVRYLYPSFGIIEDIMCDSDFEIQECMSWVRKNMSFINSNYL